MTFWDKFMNWIGGVFKVGVKPPVVAESPNEAILRIARAELGTKELIGGNNPRIVEYHTKATQTGNFKHQSIPWCASFVCWVLDKAGLAHTNNALAISYAKWGVPVSGIAKALPGDVIVRTRGKGLNHVHFLDAPYTGGSTYKGIGGNQSDAVTTSSYSVAGIKHIRRAVDSVKPSKPPVPPVGKIKSLFPDQAWTDHLVARIKASKLLTTTVSDTWFRNTLVDWVHLFAAMCRYESSFNPRAVYTEGFKNSKGEYIVSTGLFQLSYESAGGYGFKVTTEGLKDPYKNIDIAVAIMEKWVVNDGTIAGTGKAPYKGGSRFWRVLRASGKLLKVKSLYKKHSETL